MQTPAPVSGYDACPVATRLRPHCRCRRRQTGPRWRCCRRRSRVRRPVNSLAGIADRDGSRHRPFRVNCNYGGKTRGTRVKYLCSHGAQQRLRGCRGKKTPVAIRPGLGPGAGPVDPQTRQHAGAVRQPDPDGDAAVAAMPDGNPAGIEAEPGLGGRSRESPPGRPKIARTDVSEADIPDPRTIAAPSAVKTEQRYNSIKALIANRFPYFLQPRIAQPF